MMMRMTTAMILAFGLAACGGSDTAETGAARDAVQEQDRATVPADAGDGWQECAHEAGGYVASYPQGWVTNDGSVMPQCSLFDPQLFVVPVASEVPEDIAVAIHVDPVPWDEAVASEFGLRVLSSEAVTVAGQRAVRRLMEHTGDGLRDRGLQSWQYLVDWGDGRTLIASSHDAGDPEFAVKRRALDAMMERLRRP